ncbi:MAG: hypothetical protein R3E67_08830 [Pseudomonadales bacterium]
MSTSMANKYRGPWWIWVAAVLFIVAVVERVYGIDRQSLWSDELYAVIASYKPFAGAWKMMVDDSHPPGYLSFMYATLPITGYSDFGVRLHALIFGVLWMPLVFVLTLSLVFSAAGTDRIGQLLPVRITRFITAKKRELTAC